MTILKPFNAGTKQISVVILQLEIENYLMDWLLSNINITRVSKYTATNKDPGLSVQLQHLVTKHRKFLIVHLLPC